MSYALTLRYVYMSYALCINVLCPNPNPNPNPALCINVLLDVCAALCLLDILVK